MLADAVNADQVRLGAAAIRAVTPEWNEAPAPAEGEYGQFPALRRAVALSDHVIFLSTYERAFLCAIDAEPSSSSLIENGVAIHPPEEGGPARFEAAFGFSRFALVVGRIEAPKNQAMAAVAARAANVPLVCIIAAPEPDYLALVKRWAPSSFLGFGLN